MYDGLTYLTDSDKIPMYIKKKKTKKKKTKKKKKKNMYINLCELDIVFFH